ncbi:helix-turn-helix transcriptional regulator [Oculatella sp. LEGE 06141]|uniref:helix-turn-helix domain-containing protein n=1 Tax=Oculatella sp. LEGE 06141 TaxID=1828648 RepID=UPI001881BC1E|nr:helix-turn-helix transcriptional regulator [Oculatella sp. LEGE 06141]MBE9178734.1 helix-turn-helix transcriptional regulator [Oculatella sp. LEGE 06141]
MKRGVTANGQYIFGQFVAAMRDRQGSDRAPEWMSAFQHEKTQQALATWLTEQTGIKVSESAVGRLERGDGSPRIDVLIALEMASFLKFPDGSSYRVGDMVDVMREIIDPWTGDRHTNGFSSVKA